MTLWCFNCKATLYAKDEVGLQKMPLQLFSWWFLFYLQLVVTSEAAPNTHGLPSLLLRVVGNFVESSAIPSGYYFLVYKSSNDIKSHCSGSSKTNQRLTSCLFQILLTGLQQVFIADSYMTSHGVFEDVLQHILIHNSVRGTLLTG